MMILRTIDAVSSLEGPTRLAADVAEFQLVSHRIRFLPLSQRSSGLAPIPRNYPSHPVVSWGVDDFSPVDASPIHAPAANIIWFHKYVGSTSVVDTTESEDQIGSLSTFPMLPKESAGLSKDRVMPAFGHCFRLGICQFEFVVVA